MKTILIAVLLVFCGAIGYSLNVQRMERLDKEHLLGGVEVVYYHDKVGGRKFVCFYTEDGSVGTSGVSCQPTGREWK